MTLFFLPWCLSNQQETIEDNNIVSLTELWITAYEQGNLLQAQEYFEQAIIQDPSNLQALLNMWVIVAELWELTRAIRYFDAALNISPNDPLILYNKATVLSDLSYHEKIAWTAGFILYWRQALDLFDRVISIDPSFTDAYIFQGITHYDIGDYETALPYLYTWLEQEPESINALFYLWKTYKELWNNNKALEYLQQLLRHDPNHLQTKQKINQIQGLYY